MIWGSNPSRGKRFISSSKHPDWLWDYLVSYSVGTGSCFLGVKWPGCEIDHSPPSGAGMESEWSYTSAPTICFHGGV
jgi:hypothetical protein